MNIYEWKHLTQEAAQQILQRPNVSTLQTQSEQVKKIIAMVREEGDAALLAYTKAFDQVELADLHVSSAEFAAAKAVITPAASKAIEFAIGQIKAYHQAQIPKKITVESTPGITCERVLRPIQKVGLYIPGGSAPLISTVLMLAIPAQLAGCTQCVLVTPPNKQGEIDPNVLVAAELCGVKEIYKVGGAQAIAALAYGTASIPKVDKIFGPGNSWVTLAKRLVAEDVQIDMPAGPSELLVIADQQANASFIAADLLSQAEHGPDSQVILITDAKVLLDKVLLELEQQTAIAPRKAIIEQSLAHARFILSSDIHTAIAISNQYAPEHLILNVDHPEQYQDKIHNAGAVFLGAYTPETMGDYVNGSNHVLPTSGYAKSMSGLSILDFSKFISFQTVSPAGLQQAGPYAEQLANLEGLAAHANAIRLRLNAMEGV